MTWMLDTKPRLHTSYSLSGREMNLVMCPDTGPCSPANKNMPLTYSPACAHSPIHQHYKGARQPQGQLNFLLLLWSIRITARGGTHTHVKKWFRKRGRGGREGKERGCCVKERPCVIQWATVTTHQERASPSCSWDARAQSFVGRKRREY